MEDRLEHVPEDNEVDKVEQDRHHNQGARKVELPLQKFEFYSLFSSSFVPEEKSFK